MLKVTRKVLIACCLIILVSWILQNVCEGFTQQQEEELKKQNEKTQSVTPDPIQKAMTYEIGTISTDYGDTVALVRKNIIAKSGKCKYEMKTYSVKDVLGTVAGLRKDTARLGDIMSSNFRDDPVKLKKLHADFTAKRTDYIKKSNEDLENFNDRFSLNFSTGRQQFLMSHPSSVCKEAGKQEAGYVHVLIKEIDQEEFDHGGWEILEKPALKIPNKKPVRVTDEGLLYVVYNNERYTLNVKTTRDDRRTAVHDVDFEKLINQPGSGALQIWSNDPALQDEILAEHQDLDDILSSALYKIEKRIASISGEAVQRVDPIKNLLQSVTMPPTNLGLNAREQFTRKINALTAGAQDRAEAASVEYQELAKLAIQGRSSVQVAIDNMNTSTANLSVKKMSVTKAEEEVKKTNDKKTALTQEIATFQNKIEENQEANNVTWDGKNMGGLEIDRYNEIVKNLTKPREDRKWDKATGFSGEDDTALKKESEEIYNRLWGPDNLSGVLQNFKDDSKFLRQKKEDYDSVLKAEKTNQNALITAKEALSAAKSALQAHTTNTQSAIRNVKIIEQKLPAAQKAEKIMHDRVKEVEKMGQERISEFDERAEERRKKDEELMLQKIKLERAAEQRAIEERKANQAKIKLGGVGTLSNVSDDTRKILLSASRSLDQQREQQQALEEQIDSLVDALKKADGNLSKKSKEKVKSLTQDDDETENFTQNVNRFTCKFSSRYGAGAAKQFSKYM